MGCLAAHGMHGSHSHVPYILQKTKLVGLFLGARKVLRLLRLTSRTPRYWRTRLDLKWWSMRPAASTLSEIMLQRANTAQVAIPDHAPEMNSTALIRGNYGLRHAPGYLRSLLSSTTTTRAASLNSAIGRGLRQSQGVGFRGRERASNASRYPEPERKSLGRRTDEFLAQTSGMMRDGWTEAPKETLHGSAGRSRIRGRIQDQSHERGFGASATRVLRGKRDITDDGVPPRRSRAGRFNDPNSSFGQRSLAHRAALQARKSEVQFREGGLSIRQDPQTPALPSSRTPSVLKGAKRRAADSDLMARARNPDGTKLSPSRLAYLARVEATARREAEPAPLRTLPEPAYESRSAERHQTHSDDNLHSQRSFSYADRRGHDDREGADLRSNRDSRYPVRRGDGRQPANERSDRFTSFASRREDDRPAFTGRGEGERTSENRTAFGQTLDSRLPISIPYTTTASEFLYGTSVVEAALRSQSQPRRKLYKLYVYVGENRENEDKDASMQRLARKNDVEVVRVAGEWVRMLDKMSGGRPHNGYILEASPLPKLPINSLGELQDQDGKQGFSVVLDHQSREEAAVNGRSDFIEVPWTQDSRKPFVLLLDSILDPGNLGGIIRTASFLGVTAIAISTRNSASFTPVVLKASAGASENITLFSVNKPAGFVVDSQLAGWKIFAAVAPSKDGSTNSGAVALTTDELEDPLSRDPCVLMLGNEGEGLRWNLRSKADVELAIQGSKQSMSVDSLNVSVATGILCNAFLRKQAPGYASKGMAKLPPAPAERDLF